METFRTHLTLVTVALLKPFVVEFSITILTPIFLLEAIAIFGTKYGSSGGIAYSLLPANVESVKVCPFKYNPMSWNERKLNTHRMITLL